MSPVNFFGQLFQRCEGGNINFRFLGDKPINQFIPLPFLFENPDKLLPILERYKAFNSYFAVGLRKGNNGTKEAITQIPALWVDLDGSPLQRVQEGRWKPSALIETSPGKFHVYWKLREPADKTKIGQVEGLLKRLAAYFNGDLNATDASRILRIPGTLNYKTTPPFNVTIRSMEGNEFNLSDFDDLPELEQAPVSQSAPKTGDRSKKILECSFLQHCDKDRATLPEPEWYAMISILARESGGRELIHSLSRGYAKYSAKETDDKILHALNAGPPTCQRIKSLWNCGRNCGVTTPLGLATKKNMTAAPMRDPDVANQFPKEIMAGLAGDFAETFSSYLEVPPHFFFMAFLACLGHVLADRITISSEIAPQPRLYVLLLGESADDRKSTGIAKTVDLFKDAIEGFSMCWGVGSAEGLQKRLEKNNRLLLCFDEFKQFVSKCKIESSVLLPCVNTLFESNRYESRTKTSHVYLENAYLSMLAASTVSTYENTWSSQFTDIGFNNRLFLVPGSGERKFSVPARVPDREKASFKERLGELLRHSENHRELTLTQNAREIFHEWYMALERSIHTKRIDTYGLRLMSLLALNELKPEIDDETIQKVLALCNWQIEIRRLHDPIDCDNEVARMEEKIRRVLRAKGPLKSWELRRATNADKKGLWFLDTAQKNLTRAKELGFDPKEKAYFLRSE